MKSTNVHWALVFGVLFAAIVAGNYVYLHVENVRAERELAIWRGTVGYCLALGIPLDRCDV